VVFAIVNVACLVLRRDTRTPTRFRAPTVVPVIGAVACLFFTGPWARDPEDWIQYKIAGGLLAIGIVLWALTWATNRGVRAQKTGFRDPDHIDG
jgi:hypothetical protein